MDVTYLPRAEVGYSDVWPRRGVIVPPQDRDGYVLHHTVGGNLISDSLEDGLTYARRLQWVRGPDLGFDVPYNFSWFLYWDDLELELKLCICEGRGPSRSGAHTVDTIEGDELEFEWANASLVAFAAQGDWREADDRLTDSEIDDAIESLGRWAYTFVTPGLPNLDETYGHRQFKKTSCPSDLLFDRAEMFTHYAIHGGDSMVTQAEFDDLLDRVEKLEDRHANTRSLAQRNRSRLNGIREGSEADLDSDDPTDD